MRIHIFLLSLILSIAFCYGQTPLDSSNSFEDQRQKVNQLLELRSQKFGEYDLSLQEKTGIFGLFKSKSDMQKSIDILKKIVITDNNIFLETKKLLTLKDSQTERYESLANQYDEQITAYMKTISKLQAQNEKLNLDISELKTQEHNNNVITYLFIFLSIILSSILLYTFNKLKNKNVTKV